MSFIKPMQRQRQNYAVIVFVCKANFDDDGICMNMRAIETNVLFRLCMYMSLLAKY